MSALPFSPSPPAPMLSVIIVNWNTRELLARCLQSVYETVHDLTFEVFVVDNASTDGSPAMVRERFPGVRLIENRENRGFAAANNQALALAAGRYVLLLNSDTVVHPEAARVLVGFLDAHTQAGACGPRLLNPDGSLQPSCHPMLSPWREFWRLTFLERLHRLATYDQGAWNLARPHEVEVIKGACLLLRRQALDQAGFFDECYFMYSEEMDLCHRLRQGGWRLFWVPYAQVTHVGAASTGQVGPGMYVELYRSKVRFYRKVGGSLSGVLFKVVIGLCYVPRLVVAAALAPFSKQMARQASAWAALLAALPRI